MGNAIRPEPLPDRVTGDLRRNKVPIDRLFIEEKPGPALLGEKEDYVGDLEFNYGLHEAKDGHQIYYQTIVPKDKESIKRVMVFFHGFGDHVGFLTQNLLLTFAKMHGVAAIGFDLPGFGRSDGMFAYVPDWFEFIDTAVEMVHDLVAPFRKEIETSVGRSLPLFAMGESMGGGILTSIAIQNPKLFDGLVFNCPMLAVAKATRPPPPVEFLARRVLGPMLPKWPIAPAKDIIDQCFTDPAQVERVRENPLGPGTMKPRMQTAMSLAFQGCEWMEKNLEKVVDPFIIVHSKKDTVTDSAYSQKLFDQAASELKRFEHLEEGCHADAFNGGETMTDHMLKCYGMVASFLDEVSKQDSATE